MLQKILSEGKWGREEIHKAQDQGSWKSSFWCNQRLPKALQGTQKLLKVAKNMD